VEAAGIEPANDSDRGATADRPLAPRRTERSDNPRTEEQIPGPPTAVSSPAAAPSEGRAKPSQILEKPARVRCKRRQSELSLAVLPWLGCRKLLVASALPSGALRGDGILTIAAAALAAHAGRAARELSTRLVVGRPFGCARDRCGSGDRRRQGCSSPPLRLRPAFRQTLLTSSPAPHETHGLTPTHSESVCHGGSTDRTILGDSRRISPATRDGEQNRGGAARSQLRQGAGVSFAADK
jgi:hypothetical protein